MTDQALLTLASQSPKVSGLLCAKLCHNAFGSIAITDQTSQKW